MMPFSEVTQKPEPKREIKPTGAPAFTGYLSSEGIESAIKLLPTLYPSLSELIILPEKTHEKRTSRAVKIGVKTATPKSGMLFIGGVHAREIVNPDLLVKLAYDLCNAYTSNSGLQFGLKSYGKEDVKKIVENLELYIFPLVNPDGRSFVQSPSGDIWWRKNKNPNPGLPAKGVDINRNYDFLWDSGIGTSTNSNKEIYRGLKAFSEPETRNVLHIINTYQNIACAIDVHSYSELVLYPWGDDENQTDDPDMNFKNPEYDGVRGSPGDSTYREYIHKNDLEWYESTAKRIRNAIAASRGRVYEGQQGMGLYPTSGTCHDFVYTLRYLSTNRNITGFTLETGTRFQPDYSEAKNVMSEVSSGLIESSLVHIPEDTTP
jgi:murein tripeptide amidase MpaA